MKRFLVKEVVEKNIDENEESGLSDGKKLKVVQKFRNEYTVEWPSIIQSSKSAEHAFCTVCSRDFSIAHGGRDDCRKHIKTKLHKTNAETRTSNKNLKHFLKTSEDEDKVTKAELLFTAFIVEHNLPISCSDHAGHLFKKMFPDSKIAMQYGCGRTKTTSMLKSLSVSTQNDICENLKRKSFSLATDGSTDNNEVKIYPIVVSYFSEDKGKIVTTILSLLDCTDNTGEGIFNAINEEFGKRKIPWENCVAFASDNASVMNGQHKGVISFIRKVQPNINFQGCACHLLHLAAKKGCAALKQFSVEQFLTDIFYFLQKSSKRQHSFRLCQNVFGVKPHKILKYISTRWLSLFDCVERVLEQWNALDKFFCDENMDDKDNSKFLQIKADFENPTSKLYLLFLKNVLPLFVSPNTFLQQEKPLIHKLNGQIYDLFFGVLVRFVNPSAVDDSSESLLNVNYGKRKNQKSDTDLVIGGETRSYLKNISDDLAEQFYSDVRNFYINSADYIKKKLPIDDLFLKHAAVADVSLRKKMTYSSIEFLNSKFPNVLTDEEKKKLEMEFSKFQFENLEVDHEKLNIDEVWHFISQIQDSSGEKKYPALSKLILAVILVPHSNATTERVFSIVRKNQTDFRPTLGTETLTSLLIEKQKFLNSNSVCYDRNFSEQQLKAAKKSTWNTICSKKADNANEQASTSSA